MKHQKHHYSKRTVHLYEFKLTQYVSLLIVHQNLLYIKTYKRLRKIISDTLTHCIFRAGFKPERALFGKNVGAPPSHKFSDINVQKHSVDTCERYAILLLLSELRVETWLSAFESLTTYS